MPLSTVVERCLAMAFFGFVVASATGAFAQSSNVTAFNPYNGVGVSSVGSGPVQRSSVAPPAVQAGDLPPVGGPAFNPWVQGGAPTPSPQAGYLQGPVYAPATYYNPGAGLPPPPSGPIESRLTAVPERAGPAANPVPLALAPPPPTQTVTVTRSAVEPPPPAAAAPAVVVAPPTAPPPAAAPPAPMPQPSPPVASASPAPPPAEPVAPASPPAASAPLASIAFAPQSAEVAGNGRSDLDRIAKNSSGMKQLELRAYATGSDPGEARKIALARALSVRSYLIDQGVRIRIEVGAFSSGGAGGDRVDVLGP